MNETSHMDAYLAWRNSTGVLLDASTITLCAISVVGTAMLGTVLMSVFFVQRWQPVTKFTYSLIGSDLWTLLWLGFGIAISWAQILRGCPSALVEFLRLAGLITSLLHMALLASVQYVAFSHPHYLQKWTQKWVKQFVWTSWLLPNFLAIFGLFVVWTQNDMCQLAVFTTDGYRFGMVFVLLMPIVLTLIIYMMLMYKLHRSAYQYPPTEPPSHGVSDPNDGNSITKDKDNTPKRSEVQMATAHNSGDPLVISNPNITIDSPSPSPVITKISNRGGKQDLNKTLCSSSDALSQTPADVAYVRHMATRRCSEVVKRTAGSMAVRHSVISYASTVKRRERTTFFALLMLGSFLVSWLPSVLWFSLLCGQCPVPQAYMMRHHPWTLTIGSTAVNIFLFTRFPLNAILYFLRMPAVREATLRMFGRRPMAPQANGGRINDTKRRSTSGTESRQSISIFGHQLPIKKTVRVNYRDRMMNKRVSTATPKSDLAEL